MNITGSVAKYHVLADRYAAARKAMSNLCEGIRKRNRGAVAIISNVKNPFLKNKRWELFCEE